MTDLRTFYCPRCGNPILAMPSQAIGCPRCGRPVRSRFISGRLPLAMPVPAPFRERSTVAPRRGTPGIVVALLLYFFFPVGLCLLWTHPVWTEARKWKYTIIWLSIVGGLFLFALLAGMVAAAVS